MPRRVRFESTLKTEAALPDRSSTTISNPPRTETPTVTASTRGSDSDGCCRHRDMAHSYYARGTVLHRIPRMYTPAAHAYVAPSSLRTHADASYFYVWMAGLCAFVAFAAFAPTYWAPVVSGTFVGPPILHVHGFLFSAWILFFVAQSALAASGRMAQQRAVGARRHFARDGDGDHRVADGAEQVAARDLTGRW